MSILIYTRSSCAPCQTLKLWLNNKHLSYEEKNIDEQPELLEEMMAKTDRLMVPTIVVDGEVISGLNLPRLSKLLTQLV